MKKIVITYGLLSGAIIIITMIIGLAASDSDNTSMAAMEWMGYLIMIVAFAMIFIGIKQYRDHHLGGVIKFSKGFLVGLYITLIASAIYVAAWEVNLAVTDYAFIEDYTEAVIEQKRLFGASEQEVSATITEMEKLEAQYREPLYRLLITFLEIFPVGLLISLISALVLQKSTFFPSKENINSDAQAI